MNQLRLATLLLPLVVGLNAAQVTAQAFETGGSLAVSCTGSDGSFCSESNLRTVGPYASIWLWNRVEIGARMVWFQLNDVRRTFVGPTTIDLAITQRKRRMAQGELIWHFRPGKQVRPLLGVGFGQYVFNQLAACDPQRCQTALGPGLTFGRSRDSHSDTSMTVGLSVLLNPRLRVRGGWRYHNPFYDEFAVSEVFVAVGYRLGGIHH